MGQREEVMSVKAFLNGVGRLLGEGRFKVKIKNTKTGIRLEVEGLIAEHDGKQNYNINLRTREDKQNNYEQLELDL